MGKITNYLTTTVAVLFFISIIPSMIMNIKNQYHDLLKPHTKVGVIKIKDVIDKTEPYYTQLKTYFENKEIKAVLLEIDSGGGSAGASQAIFNEIQNLKKAYP